MIQVRNRPDTRIDETLIQELLITVGVLNKDGAFYGSRASFRSPINPEQVLVYRPSLSRALWPDMPDNGFILELYRREKPVAAAVEQVLPAPEAEREYRYGFFVGVRPAEKSATVLAFSGQDEKLKQESHYRRSMRFTQWLFQLSFDGYTAHWVSALED